jgi:type IV pilus assembly protein PilC
MARYFYTAKSFSGEGRTGVMEASDEHQLATALRQEGYILVSADLEKAERKLEISLPFFGGVSLVEKMTFTRNLRIMIGAGISLPRALETLAFQSRNKKFKKALISIAEELTKGKSFSDALTSHSAIFPELFISMVKVGEEAGTLEDVLKVLTNQMEREYELKSRVKGAMIYPAVIISAMIGIGILMLIIVIPKLAQTFQELAIELPPTTRFVIALGNFLAQKWYIVLILILLLVIFLRIISRTKFGKRVIDFLTLKIPIISPLIQKTNSAYFVRTLSSLITSGVPIVRSLEIVSGAVENIYFQETLKEASEKVRKGTKLSEALFPYQKLYSPTVVQMIQVGEETGETSTVLAKLADFYEEEVANATKNLSSVIEPVLMLLIGAAVGFFAISMIQPIYGMLGAIK